MALSVSLGYCLWLAGATWNDSIGRNQHIAATAYLSATQGGVLMNNASPLQSAPSSGLSFTTTPGSAVITSAAGDGAYMTQNPATQTLTCATADPTNPRIDLVCLTVVDNGNNTSFAELQIVTGTPAPSPSVPATPSNSLALYNIAVAANQTTLIAGNFTDVRVWTALAGGIVKCPNMASLPPGGPGVIGYDVVNNRLFALTATGASPIGIKAYPPFLNVSTSNVSFAANAETTVITQNFNSDGSDVLIIGRWSDAYAATATKQMTTRLYIDSTVVQTNQMYCHSAAYTDGFFHFMNWGIINHQTSSLKGTTPTAGTHTAKMTVRCDDSGKILAAVGSPIELAIDVVIGH